MTSRFLRKMYNYMKKHKIKPLQMYGLNYHDGYIFFGADFKPPLWNGVIVTKSLTKKERTKLLRKINFKRKSP